MREIHAPIVSPLHAEASSQAMAMAMAQQIGVRSGDGLGCLGGLGGGEEGDTALEKYLGAVAAQPWDSKMADGRTFP